MQYAMDCLRDSCVLVANVEATLVKQNAPVRLTDKLFLARAALDYVWARLRLLQTEGEEPCANS